MAAYGGYVAARPADISGLVSEFGTKIAAQQQAQKEREERSALLEQQRAEKLAARQEERAYEEGQSKIKDIERSTETNVKAISDPMAASGQQTYDSLGLSLVSAASDVQGKIAREVKAGRLNPLEAKITQQKLTTSVKNFASSKKDFAEGAQYLQEKMGDQSEMGKAFGATFFGMGDMPNKTFTITPSGDIYYYDVDPETFAPVPGSEIPANAFANYKAYSDKNVDYNKKLDSFTVAARTAYQQSGPIGQKKTVSEKNNLDYPKVKEVFINETIPGEMDVARFLTQVDGYGINIGGRIAKQPEKDENGKEKPIINFKMDFKSGRFLPEVKPEMTTRARTLIGEGIDARAKETEQISKNPNIIVNQGGGMETYLAKEDLKEKRKMEPLLNKVRITNDFFYNNDFGPIKAAAVQNGITKPTITDKKSYKILYGIPKGEKKIREIARFNSPREAHAYLTGKSNIVEAAAEYDMADKYAIENAIDIRKKAKGKYD